MSFTPVTPVNCPTLASDYRMDSPLPFEDWYGGLMDAACFTYPANYMGLPALSFPAGLDSLDARWVCNLWGLAK